MGEQVGHRSQEEVPDALTLEDLCQTAFAQDVPKRGGPDCDFSI